MMDKLKKRKVKKQSQNESDQHYIQKIVNLKKGIQNRLNVLQGLLDTINQQEGNRGLKLKEFYEYLAKRFW